MTEEIRTTCGARRGGRLRSLRATGSRPCTRSRCRTSSTATSTPRSTLLARWVRRCVCCGSAGCGAWRRRWTASSTTSGCGGCSASRPCTPGWRRTRRSPRFGVISYMDSVAGVYFPEGGMHAVPSAWPRPPTRPAPRSATGRRSSGSCWPTGRAVRCGGCASAGGELLPADAVVCSPDLPVAYRTLLPGLPAPRRAAARPLLALRARRGTPASAARCPPAPPTTTSTSAASGTGPSGP